MASDGDNGMGFVAGFLLGGIVGGLVGLLLAPHPGSEVRNELMDRSEDWRKTARDLASRARAGAYHLAEEGRQVVEDVIKEGRESVERNRQGMQEEFLDGRDRNGAS